MSNSDSKRYYWWKKDTNFYGDHRIVALLDTKDGHVALYVYDRLCCESTKYNGVVRFSEKRAYTNEELGAIFKINFKKIKIILQKLVNFELIELLDDGTIIIPDMPKRIGSETGAAERKRQQRANQMGDNVPKLSTRDKRLEIRDKILDYLSSSKLIYTELNRTEQFEEIVLMMTKATEITNRLPSKEKLEELSRSFMDWKEESDIHNMQGYLVNIFKMEGEQI